MPLSQATLASEMEAMVPVETEAEGIDNFATAFETYFYDASVLAVTPTPGSLAGATTAMKSAMVGVSAAGASAIQAGIVAFWGVVAVSAASIWTLAPPLTLSTPPPGLAGIAAALQPVFVSNTASELDLEDACAAIAAALHPTQLGGTATQTGAPPLVHPIL